MYNYSRIGCANFLKVISDAYRFVLIHCRHRSRGDLNNPVFNAKETLANNQISKGTNAFTLVHQKM